MYTESHILANHALVLLSLWDCCRIFSTDDAVRGWSTHIMPNDDWLWWLYFCRSRVQLIMQEKVRCFLSRPHCHGDYNDPCLVCQDEPGSWCTIREGTITLAAQLPVCTGLVLTLQWNSKGCLCSLLKHAVIYNRVLVHVKSSLKYIGTYSHWTK